MELRHLRYFIALAERLHFQSAADELGLTQPALSHALKTLEEEVGSRLIDRGRRKQVRLTPAGEAFLAGARRTIDAGRRAIQSAAAAQDGQSGVLSIGHTDDFTTDVLPDLILAFEQAHPGVLLDFQQGVSFHLPGLLHQGDVDCLFETFPLPQPLTDCSTIALPETPIALAAPSRHRFSRHKSLTIDQIATEPYLYIPTSRRSAYEYAIEKMLGGADIKAQSKVVPMATTLQIELIRRGRGVSFLTQGSTPHRIEGVKIIPIDHKDARLERVLVWREDNTNPALRHFIDCVRREFPGEKPAAANR